jgi:hypothetical protein
MRMFHTLGLNDHNLRHGPRNSISLPQRKPRPHTSEVTDRQRGNGIWPLIARAAKMPYEFLTQSTNQQTVM